MLDRREVYHVGCAHSVHVAIAGATTGGAGADDRHDSKGAGSASAADVDVVSTSGSVFQVPT